MSEKSTKNVQKRKALNVIITRRFIPVPDGRERWEYAISEFLRISLRYMRQNGIPLPTTHETYPDVSVNAADPEVVES